MDRIELDSLIIAGVVVAAVALVVIVRPAFGRDRKPHSAFWSSDGSEGPYDSGSHSGGDGSD